MCVLSCFSHFQLLSTLWTVARVLCPWESPGKNTGMDCHALLQGIFPTQGSNPTAPVSPALQVHSFPTELLGKPKRYSIYILKYMYELFNLYSHIITVLMEKNSK